MSGLARRWWREMTWLVAHVPGLREYVAFLAEARTPTRLLGEATHE